MSDRHLAIEISTRAVRLTKLNGSFVLSNDEFAFGDQQDYRIKEALGEFLTEKGIKQSDFDTFSLSYVGFESSLVPMNVFGESSAEDIYQLCFGKEVDKNAIDYNRIPELSIVNVFNIPLWVKSFFVVRFPRVTIQHQGTHLVRGMFNGATFKLQSTLVLQDGFFTLAFAKHNELQFYSSFEYTSIEDVLYYYSFTLQQKEWNEEMHAMTLSVGPNTSIDIEELEQKLKLVLPKVQLEVKEHLMANFQLQCV